MVDMNQLRTPSAILKFVELVLLVIAMATFFGADNIKYYSILSADSGLYVSSVIVPCFLNAIVLLAVQMMGYKQLQETPLEMMLYVYYVVGLFVSSILLMVSNEPSFIASGVFCLFLCLVYCLDLYFAYTKLTSPTTTTTTFPNIVQPPTPADAPVNIPYPVTSPTIPAAPEPSNVFPPPYSPPDSLPRDPTTRSIPQSAGADTVDGQKGKTLYGTNPTYPPALNYPPGNIQPYF